LCLVAIIMACKSPPVIIQDPEEEVQEGVSTTFTISQEMYDLTLAEVKQFVDHLNSLIQHKNYEGWKATLSDEFFERIASPDFLANASEAAALKSRRIVLRTPNDYFLQVVVPSRSNSKVDEIEFSDVDRVKVYYREERVRRGESVPEVRRLRLYELIKIDDTWKIID